MQNKIHFLPFKQMARRDWGRSAITGLLAPALAINSDLAWLEIITGLLAILGLICGIVWARLFIKEKGLHWKVSQKALLIFLLVVLAVSAFYWFSIRPAIAKKTCNKQATEFLIKTGGDYSYYTAMFNICMRGKGL